MMFLNPIWLFAIAAVIAPVLIHLWNIRNGRVLKVGSISLITAASRKSSRSLNLLDLLLLRCLLLMVIAVLLAMPLWRQSTANGKVKGWVLIPGEDLQQSYAKFKPSVDSLTAKGYEFHYFNKGFNKADLKQELLNKKNYPADSLNDKPVSYNALLSQLQQKAPGNIPVVVFTPNKYSRFSDDRAPVSLNITWKTFTPADSVHNWLQNAWFTANKDIVVIEGTSKPTGTTYQRFTVKPGEQNSAIPFEVKVNNGKASVNLKTDVQHAMPVDTTVYSIAVYNDGYEADAHYLEAAVSADLAFIPHHVIIKNYKSAGAIPAGQAWMFWLSEKPLPAKLKQQAAHIFSYAAGPGKVADTWISIDKGLYNSAEPQIPLFKRVTTEKSAGHPLWQDGFGEPVLSVNKQDNTTFYNFYSRFNPSWNSLVWSDTFPEIMLKLLTSNEKKPDLTNDRLTIDPQQLPTIISAGKRNNSPAIQLKSFSNYIWLLLIALFFTERWLANHKKTIQLT